MWNRISELWCKSMHSKAMWPINGKYICPSCLREYRVAWEEIPRAPETAASPKPTFDSAKAPVHQLMVMLKRFGTM